MSGICGMLKFDKEAKVDRNLLLKMGDVIRHRGPDGDGIYMDGNIGFLAKQLAVIDLTTGHQPQHNEDETLWTVLDGSVYEYLKWKEFLQNKGHKFYTASDKEG